MITVCDQARRGLPGLPGKGERLHWGYDDPSEVEGSEEERLAGVPPGVHPDRGADRVVRADRVARARDEAAVAAGR